MVLQVSYVIISHRVSIINFFDFCSYIGQSDFVALTTIMYNSGNSVNEEIHLFTSNDLITLEYDDRVRLVFTPDNPGLIPGVEGIGEYIRDTAIVNIIDNDSK